MSYEYGDFFMYKTLRANELKIDLVVREKSRIFGNIKPINK
jgi:hypothetical protein